MLVAEFLISYETVYVIKEEVVIHQLAGYKINGSTNQKNSDFRLHFSNNRIFVR